MNPTAIGIVVFVCTLGGALAGIKLRTILPDHQLSDMTRDTVRAGIGLVAMMTALVLGLVTASAKSSFDAVSTAVQRTAADVLSLDRALARYGPETAAVREALKLGVARRVDMIWPRDRSGRATLDPSATARGFELLSAQIRGLAP